jgi:hypothetical protein
MALKQKRVLPHDYSMTRNPTEAYNYPMDRSKLVVVDRFASQVGADLAKSALESSGIDAMIQADRVAGGMWDDVAWSGLGFKVLVREEDAETAREVLNPPQNVSTDPTRPSDEDSESSKPSN